MGQRMQFFLHTHNFAKKFYEDNSKENHKDNFRLFRLWMEIMEKKPDDDKAFGTDEKTTICYHHQWIYGRSAPLACLNVLDFLDMTKDSNSDTNPFSPEYGKYYRGVAPKERAQIITSVLSVFRDTQLGPYTRNSGVEKFALLNYDEPEMREDFTRGDNNDGICIIDTVTKKYCFMNFSDQDKTHTSSSCLPTLQPCSAMDYIEAYYPSTMTPGAKAHIAWIKGKENRKNLTDRGKVGAELEAHIAKEVTKYEAEMKHNAKINKKFARRFKKYKVLTLEEIAEMTPQMHDLLVNHPALAEN